MEWLSNTQCVLPCGRAFLQAEGIANAKCLRPEQAHHIAGMAKRPKKTRKRQGLPVAQRGCKVLIEIQLMYSTV